MFLLIIDSQSINHIIGYIMIVIFIHFYILNNLKIILYKLVISFFEIVLIVNIKSK